jgi:hypothetical protein
MVMTIDIPDKVVARAAALGKPVSDLVAQALDHLAHQPLIASSKGESLPPEICREPPPPGFAYLGPKRHTTQEAGEAIRAIASRNTLGGLKIKDLIEEGRRT